MDYNNEEYINNLVDDYKKTSSIKLKNELVNRFLPYFNKYAKLACGRDVMDIRNKDTITFLRLFMNLKERSSDKRIEIACIKYIRLIRKVFIDYTEQDVYDELLMYFLEALNKYKLMIADHKRSRERISFTHYIQVNLRYKFNHLICKKSRDALSGNNYIQYNDFIVSTKRIIGKGGLKEINFDWIQGKTAGESFKHLTKSERYLLYLKYESDYDGRQLSAEQISEITGLHYKTIIYRLKNIRKKLKNIS